MGVGDQRPRAELGCLPDAHVFVDCFLLVRLIEIKPRNARIVQPEPGGLLAGEAVCFKFDAVDGFRQAHFAAQIGEDFAHHHDLFGLNLIFAAR